MKKISIIVSIIVFTILTAVIIMILCLGYQAEDGDIYSNTTKVGLILNGKKDDRSWGQTHVEAFERISDELNLSVEVREAVNAKDDLQKVIDDLARTECKIIAADSAEYSQGVCEAAERHPEICFLLAGGNIAGKNIASYFGRMYQIRYLSGMIAGMHTKSGHIGYVAAYPIAEVNRGINAFTLGVRKTAPEALVHVIFCNSWNSEEKAYAASLSLIKKQKVDILAMHMNALTPLRAADENGLMSIGYNYDNSDLYPDSFLTGCVWRWDEYYKEKITSVICGKFLGENQWLDLESGIIALSDNKKNIKEEALEAVEIEYRRLSDRTFDTFYGPIKDNSGNIRIQADESMSDIEMLDSFDWYVEGVDVVEQQNK